MKKLFYALLFLAILSAGIFFYAKGKYNSAIYDPFVEGDSTEFALEVTEGQTFMEIIEQLESDGLIKNKLAVQVYLKLEDKNPAIKFGQYSISKSSNIPQLIEVLEKGSFKPGITITIKEGERHQEIGRLIKEKLGSTSKFDVNEFNNMVENPDNFTFAPGIQEFLDTHKPIGKPLEGFIYPDTYEFDAETTTAMVLEKILGNLISKFGENGLSTLQLSQQNITTFYEALTLASIIEKEASGKDNRAEISSVFHNRIQYDYPLAADSTIHYITGQTSENLDVTIDSPYNSYTNLGLPPTPINNPRMESIIAAFYPADTFNFFFFHDDEGNTYYSETDLEHANKVCEIRGCYY
jgi:UPF0755 protein